MTNILRGPDISAWNNNMHWLHVRRFHSPHISSRRGHSTFGLFAGTNPSHNRDGVESELPLTRPYIEYRCAD
jgi:hypothetical protein